MKQRTNIISLILFLIGFVHFSNLHGQTDVLTPSSLGIDLAGSYHDFTNKRITSEALYSGEILKNKKTGSIQMSSSQGAIFTSKIGGTLSSISIDWDDLNAAGAKSFVNVYVRKSKFTNGRDDFSKGKLVHQFRRGEPTTYVFNTDYPYIGISADPKGNAVYLNHITIVWNSNKQARNLDFSQKRFSLKDNETLVEPELTGAKLDDVVYSSSQPIVASVDSLTGAVEILNTGTTTITAFAPETDEYASDLATYEIKVTPSTTHTYSFRFDYPDSVGIDNIGTWNSQHSFCLQDAVVTFVDGVSPTLYLNKYDNKEGTPSIWLYKQGEILVQLPQGLEFIKNSVVGIRAHDNLLKHSERNLCSYTNRMESSVEVRNIKGEYAGNYQVKIGKAQHATFSARQAYVLPEGLYGGVIRQEGDALIVSYYYEPGDLVPAEEALILRGNPQLYTLKTTMPGVEKDPMENLLRPAFTNNEFAAAPNTSLYIFALDSSLGLGFYWQKGTEGKTVSKIANKAYLELPNNMNAHGYRMIEEDPSGITSITRFTPSTPLIYSLTGIRISKPEQSLPPGVYIINGKKKLIR